MFGLIRVFDLDVVLCLSCAVWHVLDSINLCVVFDCCCVV